MQVLYNVLHGVVYINHSLEKIKNLFYKDLITWDFVKKEGPTNGLNLKK